jgi:hypothetical protein
MIVAGKMIRAVGGAAITAVFLPCVLWGQTLPSGNDLSRYEILLTGKMAQAINAEGEFTASVEVTPNRLLLLSTADQFYVLGWGGIVPHGKKVAGAISSYAYTPDSLLMTVRNSELCTFDSLGTLTMLFKLPDTGMGISAGKNVMYVYGRNKNQKRNSLYVIVKGGTYATIFEAPAPITAVVEMNDLLLLAMGNGVYVFNPKSKELNALAAVQNNRRVRSVALDASRQRIYFSTDSSVCALKDASVVTLTDVFGGVLKYFNGGLIVFNPEKKILIRMVGIEDEMAAHMKTPAAAVASQTPEPAGFSGKWEHLNASRWLCGKAVSIAGKGDIVEASFLCGQALKAATGVRLEVAVPQAPPQPASYGSPDNVKMYKKFVNVIYEQTKKVIEAATNVRTAKKESDDAAKSDAVRQGTGEADGKLSVARQQFEEQKQISIELDKIAEEVNKDPGLLGRVQPK